MKSEHSITVENSQEKENDIFSQDCDVS